MEGNISVSNTVRHQTETAHDAKNKADLLKSNNNFPTLNACFSSAGGNLLIENVNPLIEVNNWYQQIGNLCRKMDNEYQRIDDQLILIVHLHTLTAGVCKKMAAALKILPGSADTLE